MKFGVKLAHDTAASLLEEALPRRWCHVQGVARRAGELSAAVHTDERDTLVAAGWLHDVGYAVASSGCHPIDGARWLAAEGWPEIVVRLVAHHSCARYEAAERGLAAELNPFMFEESPLQDALDTADLTTGPDGQPLTFEDRMAEILERYSPETAVHRYWLRARPVAAAAVRRTFSRLHNHGVSTREVVV